MPMTWKRFLQQLGIQQKAPSSQVFVSVNVSNPSHPFHRLSSNGFSRHSARVIIQVSIWTCILLVFLFLVIYTILLAYVDKKFRPVALIDAPGGYRRVKLQGRPLSLPDHMTKSSRTNVWNPSALYEPKVSLPQCRWQTVIRILITSSPDHRHQRNEIRNTWCKPESWAASQHAWHCVFLVGKAEESSVQAEVKEELQEHQDILLGGYMDSYRNLSLKVLHGFHWSSHSCPGSYVVKTDDDCFVNAGLLYDFLLHHNSQRSGLYAGSLITDFDKLSVVRDTTKKWAVSMDLYSPSHYPPYSSGMGYILSLDVVHKLVSHSAKLAPFPNEDAYVGVVLSRAGVSPTSSLRFVLSPYGLQHCNYKYVFLIHDVRPQQQSQLLRMAKEADDKCKSHEKMTEWS